MVSYRYGKESEQKGEQMNKFEQIVLDTVEDCIGSYENSVQDGWVSENELTREWLFDVVRGEVAADCPREVRFLGNARIDEICYHAADKFEFRTW